MEAGYGTLDGRKEDYELVSERSPSDDNIIGPTKKMKKYPYGVFLILSNEFCERFSYYGMRAILVIYLSRWLKFHEDTATSIYHSFSMACYLMPLFGAVIADGYLGRYRTILVLSVVYFLGSVIIAATAVPPHEWIGLAVGLLLVAIGTGGIKSSVAPFGADQFKPGMEKWRNSFFSAFYLMINLGSMVSVLVTPILRADVTCFGGDCYFLAFGLSALLMLIAIVLFVLGRNTYVKVPPTGNVIGKTFKCIWYGLKGRAMASHYEEKRKHWLYYADNHYDSYFIEDVHRLLKVLTMFIPLPIFWALSDQQGSRWTLQAEHVDGRMGVFGTLKPDQVQALNPIFIVVLIPLFDKVVYPLLDRLRIPNRLLQRMALGLILAAVAFLWAGFVQIKIDNAEEPGLKAGQSGVSILNTLPCSVTVESVAFSGRLASYQKSDLEQMAPGTYTLNTSIECSPGKKHFIHPSFTLAPGMAYRLFVHTDPVKDFTISQFSDKRTKPRNGDAAISVFKTSSVNLSSISLMSGFVTQYSSAEGTLLNASFNQPTRFRELTPGIYYLYTTGETQFKSLGVRMSLGSGGVYTAVLTGTAEKVDVRLFVDIKENTVSVLWMFPQYLMITLAEILFSISGLNFAYTQAPESLKSVVQSMWLLTVGVGDLVVIVVANIQAITSQRDEFFVFAGMMFLSSVTFIGMSTFYAYKPNSLYEELKEENYIVSGVDTTHQNGVKELESSENIPLSNMKKGE